MKSRDLLSKGILIAGSAALALLLGACEREEAIEMETAEPLEREGTTYQEPARPVEPGPTGEAVVPERAD